MTDPSSSDEAILVSAAELRTAVAGILRGRRVPADQADTIADLLVEADLRGVDSHGAHLLSMYATRLAAGDIAAKTTITTIRDDGSTVHLDGGHGLRADRRSGGGPARG